MFKNIFQNKKAIFFDLDGTIIDSIPLWLEAYKETAANNGFYVNNFNPVIMGIHSGTTWGNIISNNNIKTLKTPATLEHETQDNYLKKFMESGVNVRDGFWDLLYEAKTMKNFKTALVSNSNKRVVMPVLTKLELNENVFDFIITGDDIEKEKPDPEIYLKAQKALNLKTEEILVFEDSLTGAESAYRARLDTIIIWDGLANESEYKGHPLMFVGDFAGFYQNMDKDIVEIVKEEIEKAHSVKSPTDQLNPELPTEK